MPPAPKCALLSQLDSSGENKFFLCKRVSSEDTLLIRGRSPGFSLLSIGTQSGLNLSSPVCCQSLWAPLGTSLAGSGRHWFLSHIPPPRHTVFPSPFLHSSLSPEGGIYADVLPRTVLPSLSGCTIQLWVSVLVSRRQLLRCGWARPWPESLSDDDWARSWPMRIVECS